jgi:RimJ/RimL family protein N-acetyltransferase
MTLQPINIGEDKTKEIYANADCQGVLKTYDDFYKKIGFNPPWIGYFIIRDNQVAGVCGFTGQPQNGKVEIAYHTFKQFEGQGIATASCEQLILISGKADPLIIVTAKTLPENNASTKVLERNGFEFSGMVKDDDIGDAWEWTYNENKNLNHENSRH